MTRCAQEKTLPFAKRTYYTPSVRRASQRCGGVPRSAAGCVLVSFTLVALVVGTANARLLVTRHIHRVLVTEGETVRGVISTLDLVRLVAEDRLREV